MKYYLVAEFTKESYLGIENIQRFTCKKYKLYKKMQNLHIILDTIEEPNLELFNKIMAEEIKPYKKFKIQLNSSLAYDTNQKTVALKVENKGYIATIARNLSEKLFYNGFKTSSIQSDEGYNLYIPLANGNHQIKNIFDQKSSDALNVLNKFSGTSFFKIKSFELCKLNGYKKLSVIKNYPLRDF
ncbi:2'-5' RNA ligase [Clostridium hydrogenum]|uniref:2'-5' RNA ligase n=1 Tax=Clostridium hydrogenum TaxID=2855764 RepID=UPI001F2F1C56|nr:2'-5' RNA ligase [Clostridium hydrogenum]